MAPDLLLLARQTSPGPDSLAAPVAGDWLLGWGAADVPMLACLPVLLVLSGFFSGSETALFGLTEAQRMSFRHGRSLPSRAVNALLADPGMLLITILLANTTINVLFFVISSVLMMRMETGPIARALVAVLFLLAIVLTGEVTPKVIAIAMRTRFVAFTAPLLLAVHRAVAPIRVTLAHLVIRPLSRLTAPHAPPPDLDDEELQSLVAVSHEAGILDPEERRILHEVLEMRRLKVRDVMTPRVRMTALPGDASRDDVIDVTRETRLTKIPIYEGDLDHVVGILHVKRYLFDPSIGSVTDPAVMDGAKYVPELASLDQLLDDFRRSHVPSAIVVDEYGGTEGIVSVEDVVEEIVGDIVDRHEEPMPLPRMVGLGRWQVSGDLPVEDWVRYFGVDVKAPKPMTLGAFITEHVGRSPAAGDSVIVEHVRLEVETAERGRVITAIVEPLDDASLREGAP